MTRGHKKQFPVYSVNFWRSYFIHMRPYLLFVSGIAGVAGISMSKTEITPDWKCWTAFILFFLGYGFGQALTDCFQTDTDKLSAPYRPLSKGIISSGSVMAVSVTGLLFSGIIFYWLNPISFWLSLLAIFGLATYSYIKKHFWFGGPFHNAWIVALLPVMGYYTNLPAGENKFNYQITPYLIVTFLSYTNFVLIGYLKDIEADRATQYKTFPVVFSWNATILTGNVVALITLIVFWLQAGNNIGELLFGIAGSIIITAGQIAGLRARDKNEKDALFPIVSTLRSFILLHIAIVLHFQPGWWIYALIFYLLFEWALLNRPSTYQV